MPQLTNRDYIQEKMRLQLAGSVPVWAIPVGILAVLLVSARSPRPQAPWLVGGAIAAYAVWDIRQKDEALRQSYRDPGVMEKHLSRRDKEHLVEIYHRLPPDLPLGELLPLPIVEATAVEIQEPQTEETPVAVNKPESPANGLILERQPSWNDGEHLFMVGLSGGAKTTVLQGITAQCDGDVYYLTIKTDDTAPPDWQAYRLHKFAGDRFLLQLSWVVDTLEQAVQKGEKHRLIIDEYVSIKDTAVGACKLLPANHPMKGMAIRFENLVNCYIRTGRSDGHYLGLLSQTPNGTDNFASAKTQQGLRIILCASERSSEKFRFFAAWAKQLFRDLVSKDIDAHLSSVQSGYWHLYADAGRLVLNQTKKSSVEQVPCEPCPVPMMGYSDEF